jgi:hypothetical protein
VRVRDRLAAGDHSWLELKSDDLQFLSDYLLSLLSLCLVLAQLDRLPPVDPDDVIFCHYCSLLSFTTLP